MARAFTMISTTLSGSRKLRSVADHRAKFLYLMILASPLASFCGLFRYPLGIAAYDAQLPLNEAESCLSTLCDAGLLQLEPGEEVVRVVNWFSVNAPTNADHALRLTREFGKLDIGNEKMRCACFAEFLVATLSSVPRWKEEKVENLLRELRPLVSRMASTFNEVFLAAVSAELKRSQPFVRQEAEFLIPGFSAYESRNDTLSTPCQHGGHTQDLDNTDTNTKTEMVNVPSRFGTEPAERRVETSEVLRNEANDEQRTNVRPLESTKCSALVVGMRGGA